MENKINALLAIVILCVVFSGSNAGVDKDVTIVAVKMTEQQIYVPWEAKIRMVLLAIDDLEATIQERIAIYALVQSVMSQFIDFLQETGILYAVATVNEVVNEIKLTIIMMETYVEQTRLDRLYFTSYLAQAGATADEQYQQRMLTLDRDLVPRIRQMIIRIRNFIATKLAHQRHLTLLLNHLRGVYHHDEVADSMVMRKEEMARERQRMAIQALIELSIANFLAREGIELSDDYEEYDQYYNQYLLTGDEDVDAVRQFIILSKMAVLHQKEIELGILADFLRQVNFALVNNERYAIEKIRVGEPREIAAIRRLQHYLFLYKQKVRHFLLLVGIGYYKLAVTAYDIARVAEAFGLAEILAFAWDDFMFSYVIPSIVI